MLENVDFYQIKRNDTIITVNIGTFIDKTQVQKFGKKYDLSLVIDPEQNSGLKGLPRDLE